MIIAALVVVAALALLERVGERLEGLLARLLVLRFELLDLVADELVLVLLLVVLEGPGGVFSRSLAGF